MTNKERNLIKKKILKYLTEDFKGNQAIFDKKGGHNYISSKKYQIPEVSFFLILQYIEVH